MKDVLKHIGAFAIGAVILLCLICLGMLLTCGGVWMSAKVLPVLSVVAIYTLLVCLFVLIPLAVFHGTRGLAGVALFIASYIFGATAWMTALLVAYALWGFVGVFIGLFAGGVGVLPIALLATLFSGLWESFFNLILLVVATYGTRVMAFYVICKAEEQAALAQPV